jgi:hypothetical protein
VLKEAAGAAVAAAEQQGSELASIERFDIWRGCGNSDDVWVYSPSDDLLGLGYGDDDRVCRPDGGKLR